MDDDVAVLRSTGKTLPKGVLNPHADGVECLLPTPSEVANGTALLAFLRNPEKCYVLKQHRTGCGWKLVTPDLQLVPIVADYIHVFIIQATTHHHATPVELVFERVACGDAEYLRYPRLFQNVTNEELHCTLLRRKCYDEISSLAWDYLNSSRRRVMVLGNPGIGKSSLLVDEAYRQAYMHGRKTYVVFRQTTGNRCRKVVTLDSVVAAVTSREAGLTTTTVTFAGRSGSVADFASEFEDMENRNAIMLVDGVSPDFIHEVPVILFSSSDWKHEGEYAIRLCMEVWSEAELLLANDFIFHIDADEVSRRCAEWGPVPLLVFNAPQQATDSYFDSGVSEILNEGTFAGNHSAWYRICGMNPLKGEDGKLDRLGYTYSFLSNGLYLRFCKALYARTPQEIRNFTAVTNMLFSDLGRRIMDFGLQEGGKVQGQEFVEQ